MALTAPFRIFKMRCYYSKVERKKIKTPRKRVKRIEYTGIEM